ncbi:MAG: NAD-glutamate dehydrogenase domain-containing protein [Myxococcota bacterium]
MSDAVPSSEVLAELLRSFRETAEALVPSFLENMPAAYFQDTDPATQLLHLRAIAGARASGLPLDLTLVDPDLDTWTFIQEEDRPGSLAKLLTRLPRGRPLRSAKVHTAADGSFVLDVFEFGDAPRVDPKDPELAAKREEILAAAGGEGEARDALARHLAACPAEYLRTVAAPRIVRHWTVCRALWGTSDSVVELSPELNPAHVRIDLATGGGSPQKLFSRLVRYLGWRGLDIRRAHLDRFERNGDAVFILGIIVSADARLEGGGAQIRAELRRLRWVSDACLAFAMERPERTLEDAEILLALTHLAHAELAAEDPFAFARERLYALLRRHAGLLQALPDALREGSPGAALDAIEAQLASVPDRTAHRFLRTLALAVRGTLRSNLAMPERYGLTLRIDPRVMGKRDDVPFGVFFAHADGVDGFHVRFRDIARGGLRAVRPAGQEQYVRESERLYDEAYGLALAQQLKNKDIPEGGAKAVIVLAPGTPVAHGVKVFADGLLDLVTVPTNGARESLYLGPDENISFALIDWIVERAALRGHPNPDSFMSSKLGAGINHKAYGVTSEGVNVFLEEALRSRGLDPRAQRFTVKLTGGPDGDVAGNALRILHREYGEHARVVGIADGSGSAEDPGGLDWEELLRLVKASEPIAGFETGRLGPEGRVDSADDPEGAARRDELAFRVAADAFVPAGGRPGTIHAGNWERYLGADGTPSSRVIVEGANLFLTKDARAALSQAGVLIVKDSSANKCGVITSSFEVLASMLVSSADFMAVKEAFVAEVLERLRRLARLEARRLLDEHARRPEASLPELSVELSRAVTRVEEAVLDVLRQGGGVDAALLRDTVRDYVPRTLAARAERPVDEVLPRAYVHGVFATVVATMIGYREGPDYLGGVPGEALGARALRYAEADRRVRQLAERVRASGLDEADDMARLLAEGGARALLRDSEGE